MRRPDSKSSRCSRFWNWFSFGTTTWEIARNRSIIARASLSYHAAASIVSTAPQERGWLHQLAAPSFPCYDTAWVFFLGKLFERRASLDMPGPAPGLGANDCGRERRRRDIHRAPAPFR
jgi:hypothetical protein